VPDDCRAAFGSNWFERSLGSADRRAISDRWHEINQEFENRLEWARTQQNNALASQNIDSEAPLWMEVQSDLNALVNSFRAEAEARRKQHTLSEPYAKIDIDLDTLTKHINNWKARELYRRAQELLTDPSYSRDREGFERECKAVGACGQKHDFVFFGVNDYILERSQAIFDDLGCQVPHMHPLAFHIRRIIYPILREILEAEGRWRKGDWSWLPPKPESMEPNAGQFSPYVGTHASNGRTAQLSATGSRQQSAQKPANDVPRITELVELYLEDRRPVEETAASVRRVVRRFAECIGDKPATAITKVDLSTFKRDCRRFPVSTRNSADRQRPFGELLKARPDSTTLSNRTILGWFKLLGAVLAWSEEHGYIDRSPMSAGIMPEIDTDAPGREPFKPEEIVKLFSSAPFTTQRSDEPSAFWLPLLSLYTGARIEELGQLARTDVRFKEGVYTITIDDRSDDPAVRKRLKNKASRRRIPVHQQLMVLGFRDLIEKGTAKHVFPELPHGATRVTSLYSRHFSRLLNRVGIKRPALSFHSFRHTFIDAMRVCNVRPDVRSALVGHSSGSSRTDPRESATTAGYGSGLTMAVLAQEIGKVVYPGFPTLDPWQP
jgi:integrase